DRLCEGPVTRKPRTPAGASEPRRSVARPGRRPQGAAGATTSRAQPSQEPDPSVSFGIESSPGMSIAMLPARIPWRQPPTDHPMEVLDRLLDRGVVVFLRETGEAPRDASGSPRPSPRARRARPARRRRPPRGQWALDRLDRATRCLAAVTAVLREAPNAERD